MCVAFGVSVRRRVVVCAPRLPSAASRSGVSPALFLGRLQLAFAIELKLRVVALELLLRVAMVADLRCWGHGDNAGGMLVTVRVALGDRLCSSHIAAPGDFSLSSLLRDLASRYGWRMVFCASSKPNDGAR